MRKSAPIEVVVYRNRPDGAAEKAF